MPYKNRDTQLAYWRIYNTRPDRREKRRIHDAEARARPNHWAKTAVGRACRAAHESARRARTRITDTSIHQIYRRAAELRQWFDVVVDHIIPLSKGGSHSRGNLQIIYRTENERKHNSLAYVPQVVFT